MHYSNLESRFRSEGRSPFGLDLSIVVKIIIIHIGIIGAYKHFKAISFILFSPHRPNLMQKNSVGAFALLLPQFPLRHNLHHYMNI